MRSAAFRVIPDAATTSGLSGHSSEGTTDKDPNDLTATATDTDTATADGSDETATAC